MRLPHEIRGASAACLILFSAIAAHAGSGPESPPCRLSDGGRLNVAGGVGTHLQSTFSGEVGRDQDTTDPTRKVWEHFYRDSRTILVSFRSNDAHVVRCRPDPSAPCRPAVEVTRVEFEGTGTYILNADGIEIDGNFQATVVDVGSCDGAGRDAHSITIRRGLAIGQGENVHEMSGNLDCGNLKVVAPWRAVSR